MSFRPMRLAALAAVAVSIAAPQMVVAEGKPGGTLVVGSTQKPRHLNPAVQSGTATAVPGTQIFATPIRFNDKWEPQPYLAESWSFSEDGLSLTLNLRKNAKFHDGKPITSEDVAFSIDTIKANHPFKSMYGPVEKVDTPDAHTAILRMKNKHPAILLALSSALGAIIPKHVYGDGQDAKSHPANSKPVGSGPFKLADFQPGVHIILEKNEDFFIEGRPFLDKIIVKNYKDSNSLSLALDKGEVDMFPFISNTREISRLKKNADLEVFSKGFEAVGPINWLAFNTKHEILKDMRVRKAIAYATDRNFIVNALHGGFSTPAKAPIHPGSPFSNPDVEGYDLDLEKAASLLDEAGYPEKDGKRFSLTIDYIPGPNEQQKAVAEYLKPALKKVGIELEIRAAPDFPTWAKRVSGHDFALSMDIVFNWGDPVIGVHRTYLCSNIKKGVIWSNTQSYCNDSVDALLTEAGQELDQAARIKLYQEAQAMIVNEVPIYFLNTLPYHTGVTNKVGNPPLSIWGAMSPMDNVYLK